METAFLLNRSLIILTHGKTIYNSETSHAYCVNYYLDNISDLERD